MRRALSDCRIVKEIADTSLGMALSRADETKLMQCFY